jgi:hypothetical protein
MGQDIEAVPQARISEDVNSLKAPTRVGREELADIVRPHESYEGLHRFDSTAKWTSEEERRVVRKTDLRLLTWLCLMMLVRLISIQNKLQTLIYGIEGSSTGQRKSLKCSGRQFAKRPETDK